jgi:hypothetical protein
VFGSLAYCCGGLLLLLPPTAQFIAHARAFCHEREFQFEPSSVYLLTSSVELKKLRADRVLTTYSATENNENNARSL